LPAIIETLALSLGKENGVKITEQLSILMHCQASPAIIDK